MSLRFIEDLETAWTQSGALAAVDSALAEIGFDDDYVEAIIAAPRPPDRPKVIKDGIWGMIEVAPSHVLLLDCPIMQRLRTIHQLGFSYLTYPSAEHSRFSHSLGMFSVVSRFLRDICQRNNDGVAPDAPYEDWKPNAEQVLLAEHAAILHDVGHMPFSHVTEQILQGHSSEFTCGPDTVDDFIFPAEQDLAKNKLAELLSVAIVLAPRFQKFYRAVVHPGSSPDAPHRIAALILGVAAEPALAGIANLISGSAIDADKIDYINRDASACGIAVGVDVARLFLRSRFLRVGPAELKRLRSTPHLPEAAEVIFVVNASGLDSIEEIGQARTMLYHRVYLHQTTRNAERLLGKALQACLTGGDRALTDALRLWVLDDFGLLRLLAGSSDPDVSRLARRVSSRQLPKRASAFGKRFLTLSTPLAALFPNMAIKGQRSLSKQIVGNALEEFRSKVLRGHAQVRLEAEIQAEVISLRDLLAAAGKAVPKGRPVISVLPMPSVEERREDAIILDNEQLALTSTSSVSDEQMEAADIMKSTGYILADAEWKPLVFLASRKTFYKRSRAEHEVQIEPYLGDPITVHGASRLVLDERLVAQRIRMSGNDLDRVFRDASEVSYFAGYPRLVPLSVDEGAVADLAEKLRDFSGQGNWRVTRETIRSFLLQFPPALRNEVLVLLRGIETLDRVGLSTGIRQGLSSISSSGRNFVTALSPDSGSTTRTLAEQELKAQLEGNWTFEKSIRAVFESAAAGDTVALCDDNITSGSQAAAQFLAWMGVPRSDWPIQIREERGIEDVALNARDRSLLQQLDIWIVVATAGPNAEAFVSGIASDLGLKFRGVRSHSEIGTSSHSSSPELENFLKNVGTGSLAWCRHGYRDIGELSSDEKAKCEADALGYSNARGLMCTTLNVPVGTYTALWAPGYVGGEPWMPLLIRRGYLSKIILS